MNKFLLLGVITFIIGLFIFLFSRKGRRKNETVIGLIIGILGIVITLLAWFFPLPTNLNKVTEQRVTRIEDGTNEVKKETKEINKKIKALEEHLNIIIDAGGLLSAPREVFDPFAKGINLMKEYRWNDAIAKFKEAMKDAKTSQLIFLYNLIGVCYYAQDILDLAIENWYKSLTLAKDCGNREGEKTAVGNIRLIFQSRGYSNEILKDFKGF
jgi:tetratricopeptide (TPR) repeat protein